MTSFPLEAFIVTVVAVAGTVVGGTAVGRTVGGRIAVGDGGTAVGAGVVADAQAASSNRKAAAPKIEISFIVRIFSPLKIGF